MSGIYLALKNANFPDGEDDEDFFLPHISALKAENTTELKQILDNLSNKYDDVENYEILLEIALKME